MLPSAVDTESHFPLSPYFSQGGFGTGMGFSFAFLSLLVSFRFAPGFSHLRATHERPSQHFAAGEQVVCSGIHAGVLLSAGGGSLGFGSTMSARTSVCRMAGDCRKKIAVIKRAARKTGRKASFFTFLE